MVVFSQRWWRIKWIKPFFPIRLFLLCKSSDMAATAFKTMPKRNAANLFLYESCMHNIHRMLNFYFNAHKTNRQNVFFVRNKYEYAV